ncbi:tryptophan-rich sensory protein [Paracrocinitomix mangrovi]|uniref:TspO/MBR family protein n=1 Tax=Paracrocinitomix mangrovi TaxID=2862509 RepID=UPI001C8D6B8D|nr:TspO/MBR family protein [Paracrocinitomix mangrovi]UKN02985.1 tryptophan-rich sensory protein [Paracrocinitomix mangrovi]
MTAKKKYIIYLFIYLIVNFAALGLGGLLQGEGPSSEWYQNLNRAPWTPPGWVFGAAWFTIMICLSFFMAKISKEVSIAIMGLFSVQWLLNVSWNPIFFDLQMVPLSLAIISLLAIVVIIMFIVGWQKVKWTSFLLLPYIIWLLIAISLNFYIYRFNGI